MITRQNGIGPREKIGNEGRIRGNDAHVGSAGILVHLNIARVRAEIGREGALHLDRDDLVIDALAEEERRRIVLAGIVGSGKSSLAKSIYTRSLPFGRRVYVPGDPKGEHSIVAEAVGGRAIVLGHGLRNRLNPLDEGHRPSTVSDAEWASQVAARRRDLIGALAETVLDRTLSPLEHTAIDLALNDAVRSSQAPILPMVVDRILAPSREDDTDGRLAEDGRLVGHALRRLVAGDLQGLFDGPSTVRFDPSLPMVSLDLSRVAENSTLSSVLMTCSSAWMESALSDPNGDS